MLKIDGDVKGSTGVVAHVVSEDVKPENKILFVEAPNDDASTAADFRFTGYTAALITGGPFTKTTTGT